jgi:hypothetical protein
MGDGSRQNEGLNLSVYAFTSSDIDLLIKALNFNFNVEITLHKTDKGYRIYINKSSTNILKPIVLEYFVPSIKYKMGL